MRPEMTIYNTVSLDGRLTGFEADLDLYYGISSAWGNDGVLIGSETILRSLEEVPEETQDDRRPPSTIDDKSLPYVIFVDSKGRLRSHHVFRHLPYIREVLVLISKRTPDEYRKYLLERDYQYIETGEDQVDLVEALKVLYERFGLRKMRTDTGGVLNKVLMDQGLVDRVVVLMNPVLAGSGNTPFFEELNASVKLRLEKVEKVKDGRLLISYNIQRLVH